MHNSEGGLRQALDYNSNLTANPLDGLMNKTCLGCHTGANDGLTPMVFNSTAPNYDLTAGSTHETLAGGNFHWIATGTDDLKGHNIFEIDTVQNSRVPPGSPGAGKTFDATTPLTCAGENGCHGYRAPGSGTNQVRAIWGAHHVGTSLSSDGSTPGRSYRYLLGVKGYEDPDWEYSMDQGATYGHNQYRGKDRTADGDDTNTDITTISHLCADCHGDFHNGAGSAGVSNSGFQSPWIRHPVDFDMGRVSASAGSEYAHYGGGTDGAYMIRTPLASNTADNDTPATMLSTVTLTSAAGDAIITCITCHRAHGSPYDYSLRWDYKNWPGGNLDGGCYDCHTAKN